MKFLVLFLCSFCLSVPVLAQELYLRSLLKFQKSEQAVIHEELLRKGWTFMSDDKVKADTMGKAVWAFQHVGEGATAWLVLYYNDTSPNRILYNLYDGRAINKIRKKIRRRKMGVLEEGQGLEKVQHLDSYTDYTSDLYVMRLLTYQLPGYSGIKIFEREDYLKAKRKGRL